MKELVLSKDILSKGWGGVDQYWFSVKDYTISDISTLAAIDKPDDVSQTEYFLSLGYIPYFAVNNEEVIRAYVDVLDNKKLMAAMKKIDDKDYVESFWKYFNAFPQLAHDWEYFESDYLLKKAIDWCDENGIPYSVPKE